MTKFDDKFNITIKGDANGINRDTLKSEFKRIYWVGFHKGYDEGFNAQNDIKTK